MGLHIHDTRRRAKVAFERRGDTPVTLYVCGPTVYSYAHVGNARPAVVFDVLFRLLRRTYGDDGVVYARNITDVDDKIAAAATSEGVDITAIATRFTDVYRADMTALGVLPPTVEPLATDHIGEMIAMILTLIARGHAYEAQGDVLFDVTSFADYGALSGRTLDDLVAGARVEVADYKRNPADFTLWKPSKPGEPAWDSPWGAGRPGWHIECSAMIEKVLGLPVDIHGGGHDLIFPHHENEIAQGACAHGGPYARYWMHNGFLTMDAEKMSKSLGNVLLVHNLLEEVPGEVVRWALLSAHYRAPLDWTGDLLEQSRRTLDRLYDAKRYLRELDPDGRASQIEAEPHAGVLQALEDDLNTPQALSVFGNYVRDVRINVQNSENAHAEAPKALAGIAATAALLGFLQVEPDAWFKGGADAALGAQIEALIAKRAEARKTKDWNAADTIRAQLSALNVEVLDGPNGAVTWRLKA